MRRFRSFLRTEFDQGRKISLYQHWSDQTYLKNVRNFMDRVGLPNDLKDEQNALKLLTIIFPQTLKKIRPFELASERENLSEIFRENCASRRLEFF